MAQRQRITFFLFFILILTALLSSCSTTTVKRDGPPNYYVDETKVVNAVPKPEPLAKYGNMRYYHVFGKRYYTMRSSRNYDQTGIASWYGTQFHDRKTSSGEMYSMLGMTAAHKTLPLPTYVEVTNLKNHRTIIVKVNDRGPFAEGRIIDLSYVAAKKLGMLGHGTANVRVKAIDPYTYGKPMNFAEKTTKFTASTGVATHSVSTSKALYLQVGAFKERFRAEKLRQRLVAYVSAPINIDASSAGRKLYRVQVGPFNDIALANKISEQLKLIGINANRNYRA